MTLALSVRMPLFPLSTPVTATHNRSSLQRNRNDSVSHGAPDLRGCDAQGWGCILERETATAGFEIGRR